MGSHDPSKSVLIFQLDFYFQHALCYLPDECSVDNKETSDPGGWQDADDGDEVRRDDDDELSLGDNGSIHDPGW